MVGTPQICGSCSNCCWRLVEGEIWVNCERSGKGEEEVQWAAAVVVVGSWKAGVVAGCC
jgi:hypothetical protein